ncbi:uncharacterized protein LOC134720782 [Mytilus trossulus]|uniref:uncharacterized protein LOC134720782 n=1 Tax=Mytilus trossulus TaxID=6551 RepID=UPI0030048AB4
MSELDYLNEPQCMKHGARWRARFQQLMNILRAKFTKQYFHKVGEAICTCGPDDDIFRFLPEKIQEKRIRKSKDTRWAELITDEVAEECYKYFNNYIETNFDKTKDEYGHLKDILHVLKERGQLSSRLNSANRFLYVFYKFDKDKDTSLLNPPPEPPKKEEVKDGVKEEPMTPAVPLEKLDMHLKSLRPEDVGNFIGKKGIHIRRLLKEKQGSKITMGKEEGHVKIEIEATKEDLQEIKDRLLQREALVNQARRQHEESVRQYNEMMGEPSSMDYQSAEENMDQ